MSDSEESPFASLIGDFMAEVVPLVERISTNLLRIERMWADGSSGDELMASVRKDLHTVKGNAGMMGLTPIQDAAHAIEDLCLFLVERPEARDQNAADLLVDGGSLLVDMMHNADKGEIDPRAGVELARRVARLVEQAGDVGESRHRGELSEADRTVTRALDASRFSADTSVRVDLSRLDQLVEISGDLLVRFASMVDDLRRMETEIESASASLETVLSSADLVYRSLEDLQSRLLETRLVPISGLFARFPRLVRDLSRDLGKKIRLTTKGEETRIDKGIIDGISESLIHLVRNAIDHGLEVPEERTRASKPEEGFLRLTTALQGDAVLIDVIDDGKGIDVEAVTARARALGLEGEQLSWRDLIFQSGLSTAERVSKISGRGVGLDVVAEAIRNMGGTIEVDTRLGLGARFRLRLPLTLTVTSVLLFESGGSLFAIPVQNVAEILNLDAELVAEINRNGVVIWRGQSIAISTVPHFHAFRASDNPSERTMIVVSAGRQRRGIAVTSVLGHKSVVLKKLDPILGDLLGFAGATILGDGRIALVLDVSAVVDQRKREAVA